MTSPVVDAGDGLPLTVPALLHERANRFGDQPFVVCDDDVLTYREAMEESSVLARGLLAVGAGKGTHIGLLHANRPEFVVGWLAATRVGAVALPFSTFSRPAELAGLLRGSDVEVLLSARTYRSHDYEATLAAALPSLDLAAPGPIQSIEVPALRRLALASASDAVHADHTLASILTAATDVDPDVLTAAEADVTPADPMVIVHTSGSTSEPKGVVHAHGPLLRHLDNLNQIRAYGPEDVLFANSPWFWIGGFAYALLGTLVAGARLVCSNAVEASGVLDVLERERPNVVNGFAASIAHLPLDPSFPGRDLSSIRRGNLWPLLPDDVRPADPGLRHGMLGMTEAGSVCLLDDDGVDLPEHQRGSFGRPAPGFETRILHADTGAPCPVGEVGVLWLRGPFLMEGYYGRERSEAFDPDGWFCTGDLFHVDADGLHYFHGRAGDMIKTAGANVSPREVEGVLADAGVRAHVLGIDDAHKGQLVAAAVVGDPASIDLDELRALLGERLSAYKVPKAFIVLREDEVPMMSSGKLDARGLRTMFDDR